MSGSRQSGGSSSRLDRVVPVAVEAAGTEADLRHLLVADLPALGVLALVDLATDAQPGLGPGRGDEVDDGHQAGQRPSAPVGADVGEQPVLDLVPLAGARREVADGDGKSRGVGQALEFPLPQADLGPVAAAAVGGDQQRAGFGKVRGQATFCAFSAGR